MKDPKNDLHLPDEAIERVRSFLNRSDGPNRDSSRHGRPVLGACLVGQNHGSAAGPPFLNLTQHYLKNYFGPSAETLEALPNDMFVYC